MPDRRVVFPPEALVLSLMEFPFLPVQVSGSGWRPEELTAIVGLELPLRELNLAKCDALTATQIKQLPKLAVATLRRVRLPARLQDESAHTNALIRRGVDIRWL